MVGGIVAVHCRWHGDDRTEDLRANQSHIIEVYLDPADPNPVYRERFAEVEFQLDAGADGDVLHAPAWRYIDRASVEALIGGPFSAPFTSSY